MGGQPNPMRASRMPGPAHTDGNDRNREVHPLAPFLAIVGASLPWLVHDALIKSPEDFWSAKGCIVLAAVAVGVVLFGLSWHFSRRLPARDE